MFGTVEMKKTIMTTALVFVVLLATSFFVFEIQMSKANPYYRVDVYTDVPPPDGTLPPIISIQKPQNGSFQSKNVTLNFDVIIPKTNGEQPYGLLSEVNYKGNWKSENIVIYKNEYGGTSNTSFSIDLSDVRGGNMTVTVYVVGVNYNLTRQEVENPYQYNYYDKFQIASYSTVSFTKDLVPPRISIQSPQNTTYITPNVPLDFTVNENISQSLYNLDNKGNQTISGNSTLTDLSNGEHKLTLYVADLAGNVADPKTITFSVDLPEPFPILLVAVSITVVVLAVMSVGLLVSRRQSKRPESK